MESKGASDFLEQAEKKGMILGLARMYALLEELSGPEKGLSFIHIAGTNGKGSVTAFLSSILTEAGYKVGGYYSPAVENRLEQYRICGNAVSGEEFESLREDVQAACERLKERGEEEPTLFEIETAIAFLYFKKNGCLPVLLETGCGGAEDATNVIEKPLVSVLTSISEDHIGLIGKDIYEIAKTKAGIIKPGSKAVVSCGNEITADVIKKAAEERGAELQIVDPLEIRDICCGLREQVFSYKSYEGLRIHLAGNHQIENAALAVEVCDALKEEGFVLSEDSIRNGLKKAFLPFRMEIVREEPLFLLDGAHNPEAVETLMASLKKELPGYRFLFIMGMLRDKDYRRVCELSAPVADRFFLVETEGNRRALRKETLKETLAGFAPKKDMSCTSVREAVFCALKAGKEMSSHGIQMCIVSFGSFSYLREVKECLKHMGDQ
ncbi:MAG: bifunctional folylpolyglutamate synthase/dihydrofolate synthase [Lachnospiraceae bacterium]|nr:bifunctional folylpolyglutamate synthase/dihydrofolate synthase [Lachnospiraceae bacterium]